MSSQEIETGQGEWNQSEFDHRFEEAMQAARSKNMILSRNLYSALLDSKPQGYLNLGSTLLNFGKAEYSLGNLPEAARLMEGSLRVWPGCISTYKWLAHVYWKAGKYYKYPVLLLRYWRNIRYVYKEQLRLQE